MNFMLDEAGQAGVGVENNAGSGAGNNNPAAVANPATATAAAPSTATPTNQATPTVDYDKIQKMLNGVLAAKENTTLKAYFAQQGLSEQEMTEAINAYKAEKAKNTPDPAALTQQLAEAKQALKTEQINNAAKLAAMAAGVPEQQVQFVLKLSDFSQVTDENGNVDAGKVKEAIDAVLTAVPAFKSTSQTQPGGSGTGFHVGTGAGDNNVTPTDATTAALNSIFGVSKTSKMSL